MSGFLIPVTRRSSPAAALIRAGQVEGNTANPWRYRLDELGWSALVEALARDPLHFIGLWCDGPDIHALFLEAGTYWLMASLAHETERYPGLSGVRQAASPFERMLRDQWGVEAMEARDLRPWLDHGAWKATAPLSRRPVPSVLAPPPPEFLPTDALARAGGAIMDEGPVTGGMEGPLHLRLGAVGPRIVTAEIQTGYAHRGVTARMVGQLPQSAAELAARIGAGSSVAHQWAFCAALEQATGTEISMRAHYARALLAEIERICTHLTDLARTARAAGGEIAASRCGRLRETITRCCARATGSRLLMDCVRPGGVLPVRVMEPDPGHDSVYDLSSLAQEIVELGGAEVNRLRDAWLAAPGLAGRLRGAGILTAERAADLALDGVVGRACGRSGDPGGDLRTGMVGYVAFRPRFPLPAEGPADAQARSQQRLDEIEASLGLIGALGEAMAREPGSFCVALAADDGKDVEGCAGIEGPRGAIWHVVRLRAGRVASVFVRDPALGAIAALEAALPGTHPLDVALVRHSFGISTSCADL